MTVKIRANGPIISNDEKWFYDRFEMEAICPRDIIEALPSDGENVEITVNSYGGYVDQGNEIYTALLDYQGNVTINVVMAGSAASVFIMAANTVRMSPPGQIMIHNVSMGSQGDYHDMDKASEILQKANLSLAIAYEHKTKLPKKTILDLMDSETWLTAEEAVEKGFADEIMQQGNEKPLLVANGGSGMIPSSIINEMQKFKNSLTTLPVQINETQIKNIVNSAIDELREKTVINGKSINEWIAEAEKQENNQEPEESDNLSRLLYF